MECLLAVSAALLSFSLNWLLVKRWAALTVVAFSPVIEESAKTLPAYYLGGDIVLVHFFFGVIEGIFDFCQNKNTGLAAAFLSVGGHSFFGWLTVFLDSFTNNIWIALAGAVISHIFWNAAVNRLAGGGMN